MIEGTGIYLGGEVTHLSRYLQKSTDTCTGQALPAKFKAENAVKCVTWSLKFQNFPGEHAPDSPSGLGLRPRLTVALQTTLSTPSGYAPAPPHNITSKRAHTFTSIIVF